MFRQQPIVESVTTVIEEIHLGWLGHIHRERDERVTKQVYNVSIGRFARHRKKRKKRSRGTIAITPDSTLLLHHKVKRLRIKEKKKHYRHVQR